MGHIAVIDIGKTNAKLALVRTTDLAEVAVVTRPNTVRPGPPYPHFDVQAHWAFLLAALRDFHAAHGIDAISVTTHGASGVLLAADGTLAAPVLDYEHTGPNDLAHDYDALRPDFALTGSPRLPMGLNLGAQLHWQFATDPGLLARTSHVLTYPQYWGHLLTGQRATDVTSLGCHTDLWVPNEGRFSLLVDALGLADKIAPARRSDDVLGTLRADVAAATGLPGKTPVYVGIHDSNASLYPHILSRPVPFSVVSTGTWVICMTVGGTEPPLDPAQDTLINVNALGQPVPSARFMGGREHDLISGGRPVTPTTADIAAALETPHMLHPAVVHDSGPFRGRQARWTNDPPKGSGTRSAALAFYLALMTDHCLRLTGHRGTIVVEGPFARNMAYLEMLAAASGCPVTASEGATGTSRGAALLATGASALPQVHDTPVTAPDGYAAYADLWRAALA